MSESQDITSIGYSLKTVVGVNVGRMLELLRKCIIYIHNPLKLNIKKSKKNNDRKLYNTVNVFWFYVSFLK